MISLPFILRYDELGLTPPSPPLSGCRKAKRSASAAAAAGGDDSQGTDEDSKAAQILSGMNGAAVSAPGAPAPPRKRRACIGPRPRPPVSNAEVIILSDEAPPPTHISPLTLAPAAPAFSSYKAEVAALVNEQSKAAAELAQKQALQEAARKEAARAVAESTRLLEEGKAAAAAETQSATEAAAAAIVARRRAKQALADAMLKYNAAEEAEKVAIAKGQCAEEEKTQRIDELNQAQASAAAAT